MRKIQGKWGWLLPLIPYLLIVVAILVGVAYLVYFELVVPLGSIVSG